jgi:UDP-N-acetylmuramoyl-tripeptide--D-alanyl-D-alanine ligase
MISFLSFLWFLRESKAVLFWIYLWQLKEYHTGRFIDHFRTAKGKNLLFNKLSILKIVFIPVFFVLPVLVFFALTFIYIAEGVKFGLDFFRKKIKRPVFTKKTILLITIGLVLEFLFLLFLAGFSPDNIVTIAFCLLVFDVFTPLIVSIIVLLFQPLAVLSRNQLIRKAKGKRGKFKDLLVIGITGSYGKTSTKEILAAILSEKFKVSKTKEHQNSEVGISQCILQELKPEHEVFVVEMGAYNRGGIKLLAEIVKPDIGILTGINEQHMATFGSQDNIIKAKYELIEALPNDGVAFFNAKNPYCVKLYQKTKIKKQLYGQEASFPGEENILGAMAVARELGMTEEEISRAVAKIENKFGGIKFKKGINGLKIIDATYSANPTGIMAHLEYLKTFPGKKIIVMPCLIELGRAAIEVHQRIGKKIGEVCDLAIITTKDRFKEIQVGAQMVEVRPRPVEIVFIEEPKNILEKIKSFAGERDVVLLESRVPDFLIKQLIEK